MKDLSGVTKMSPNQRRDVIRRFLEEVQRTDVTREILSEWGLHLSSDLVRFTARHLEPEMIYFGNNKIFKTTERADWSSAAVKNPVLRSVSILTNNYWEYKLVESVSLKIAPTLVNSS